MCGQRKRVLENATVPLNHLLKVVKNTKHRRPSIRNAKARNNTSWETEHCQMILPSI